MNAVLIMTVASLARGVASPFEPIMISANSNTLTITVDGRAYASWELTNKDPDVDSIPVATESDIELCLVSDLGKGCRRIANDQVGAFTVLRAGRRHHIVIKRTKWEE